MQQGGRLSVAEFAELGKADMVVALCKLYLRGDIPKKYLVAHWGGLCAVLQCREQERGGRPCLVRVK